MGPSPNERGLSRKHIMHAIDDSLRRLGMDYVDLYQIHRFDRTTPIEETLEALTDVVKAGKALYIGASSMYAWQFAKMLETSDRLGLSRFVTMQNHYNLVYREEEREMIPLCLDRGIGLIPWSPLARGFLAGNRSAGPRRRDDALAHRRLRPQSLLPRRRLQSRRSSRRSRGEARRPERAGGARLAPVAAGRDGADHRGEQDEPPRRRAAGARIETRAGRDQGARGALPAAPDPRTQLRRRATSVTPADTPAPRCRGASPPALPRSRTRPRRDRRR